MLHFASPASPSTTSSCRSRRSRSARSGTHKALELARRKDARFFLASTSEVYGDPLVHPQREDYWGNVNPIGPRGVYDEAKRFAEAMTMAYHRHHGVDTRIVRIFNTYGPRMRPHDGRVVSNFIVQALTGEPLTIYGDGTQTRSFCYVADEVEGSTGSVQRGDAQPTNIGNPDEFTVRQLAELVVELTGSRSTIVLRAAAGGRSQGAPARTSRARGSCSGGSRRCTCARGSRARSSTSAAAGQLRSDGASMAVAPSRGPGAAASGPGSGRAPVAGVSFPDSLRTDASLAGISSRYAFFPPGAGRHAAACCWRPAIPNSRSRSFPPTRRSIAPPWRSFCMAGGTTPWRRSRS